MTFRSAAPIRRIGMIVPSLSTTMETEIPELLRRQSLKTGDRFSFHSARLRLRQVTPEALTAMNELAIGAVATLCDAEVDARCTRASYRRPSAPRCRRRHPRRRRAGVRPASRQRRDGGCASIATNRSRAARASPLRPWRCKASARLASERVLTASNASTCSVCVVSYSRWSWLRV